MGTAFKAEKTVEVWAGPARDRMTRLATYPIQAASGALGPMFTLAALVQSERRGIIISPVDFRARDSGTTDALLLVPGLYERIRQELAAYPAGGG